MNILETKNVGKNFNEIKALNAVSFEVKKGEILGIAGPNGAGKSTLFNVIAGNYRGSGEILFEDKIISGQRPHQICRLGVARTFQIPVIFNTLSVYDNVRVGAHFGRAHRKEESKRINEVLDFVGLTSKKDLKGNKLDLLDKKLSMLAAALATEPRLLLLDEPMGGLHPSEIEIFKTLIKKVNQDLGVSIIIIEHLIKTLAELSNRMMILYFGEKLCIGTPHEVVKNQQVIDVYLGVDHNA